MNAANRAKEAVEALSAQADFQDRRSMVLVLVLEHLIQSAGDRKAVAELRRKVEGLESGYRKVVKEANMDAVVRVDLSPGLAERYGVGLEEDPKG